MARQPRWVIFTDHRGVLYCEAVAHRQIIFQRLLGTKHPELVRTVVEYEGKEVDFINRCNAVLGRGYVLDEDHVFLGCDVIGLQEPIYTITDKRAALALKAVFDKMTPEAVGLHNKSLAVQPFTAHALNAIQKLGDYRKDIAGMYNGPALSIPEQDWVRRWVEFG